MTTSKTSAETQPTCAATPVSPQELHGLYKRRELSPLSLYNAVCVGKKAQELLGLFFVNTSSARHVRNLGDSEMYTTLAVRRAGNRGKGRGYRGAYST